ncbi:hypothetical protein M153_4910004176 [Pseudoloma neurophilia]|uniref:CCHC-type domain-containing protein n=1 Tax=Pseudoloma neurophilia TaxID=146866 RepID=A0A0R0LX63_9MICR|nr:hypothetical protein M153_4910004176 [Pseudoloma neurophilia]
MVAQRRNLDEIEVLEVLKKCPAPTEYNLLFYTGGLKFDNLVQTVEDWKLHKSHRAKQEKKNNYKLNKREFVCYNCQGKGHMAGNCLKKKGQNLLVRKPSRRDQDSEIDIGGIKERAVFDTRSDVNIVTYKKATQLRNYGVISTEKKELTFFNSQIMRTLSLIKY